MFCTLESFNQGRDNLPAPLPAKSNELEIARGDLAEFKDSFLCLSGDESIDRVVALQARLRRTRMGMREQHLIRKWLGGHADHWRSWGKRLRAGYPAAE